MLTVETIAEAIADLPFSSLGDLRKALDEKVSEAARRVLFAPSRKPIRYVVVFSNPEKDSAALMGVIRKHTGANSLEAKRLMDLAKQKETELIRGLSADAANEVLKELRNAGVTGGAYPEDD